VLDLVQPALACRKPWFCVLADKARKGAVKKRTQRKTKLGGVTAFTKRSKTSGEFMAVQEACQGEEGGQEIQRRTHGEWCEKNQEEENRQAVDDRRLLNQDILGTLIKIMRHNQGWRTLRGVTW
jgi:hypothetical protein